MRRPGDEATISNVYRTELWYIKFTFIQRYKLHSRDTSTSFLHVDANDQVLEKWTRPTAVYNGLYTTKGCIYKKMF